MDRCTICHTLIEETEASRACERCDYRYHDSCWDSIGGCATFGCDNAAVAEKPTPTRPHVGWGDEKKCPGCGEVIPSEALDCDRCYAVFPTTDPISRSEYGKWLEDQDRRKIQRRSLVWFFVLSLLGYPAFVFGPIAGWYAYKNRAELATSGGTYLAMGYSTAALGGAYMLLLLLLALGA